MLICIAVSIARTGARGDAHAGDARTPNGALAVRCTRASRIEMATVCDARIGTPFAASVVTRITVEGVLAITVVVAANRERERERKRRNTRE